MQPHPNDFCVYDRFTVTDVDSPTVTVTMHVRVWGGAGGRGGARRPLAVLCVLN
jgi:hypothetical protein